MKNLTHFTLFLFILILTHAAHAASSFTVCRTDEGKREYLGNAAQVMAEESCDAILNATQKNHCLQSIHCGNKDIPAGQRVLVSCVVEADRLRYTDKNELFSDEAGVATLLDTKRAARNLALVDQHGFDEIHFKSCQTSIEKISAN